MSSSIDLPDATAARHTANDAVAFSSTDSGHPKVSGSADSSAVQTPHSSGKWNPGLPWPGVLLALAVLSLAMISAYAGFHRTALQDTQREGAAALQRLSSDLRVSLEKYEHLPYLVAAERVLMEALQSPHEADRVDAANRYLSFAQSRTDVAAIYLMNTEGQTLAASNWAQATSFVGRNYRFRPYFQDALQGGTGHFYGVGVTTGEPGFFIAAPIVEGARVIGVVAVKIDLNAFEQKWRAEGWQLAVTDPLGVLFLTTQNAWRYRSLHALPEQVLAQLGRTQQYGNIDATPLSKAERMPINERLNALRLSHDTYWVQGHPLGRFDWQLLLFSDPHGPRSRGLLAAELVGMGLALVMLVVALGWQHRRRVAETRALQRERARVVAELEQRIATRTAELTAANETAVQTGKLALLGQMAAGISHEISQPLTALRTLADNANVFLARADTEKVRQNLHVIGDLCQRIGRIVGELKAFARKEPARLEAISLRTVISSSLMLIEPLRQASGTQIVCPDTHLCVMGDSTRLEQVLVNLLRNGIDAMESQQDRRLAIEIDTPSPEQVRISVQDMGPGLPPEVVVHLFEPFFTTKPSGKGLGLGLALSQAIVREMDGSISAVNTPLGARFDVMLRSAQTMEQLDARTAD